MIFEIFGFLEGISYFFFLGSRHSNLLLDLSKNIKSVSLRKQCTSVDSSLTSAAFLLNKFELINGLGWSSTSPKLKNLISVWNCKNIVGMYFKVQKLMTFDSNWCQNLWNTWYWYFMEHSNMMSGIFYSLLLLRKRVHHIRTRLNLVQARTRTRSKSLWTSISSTLILNPTPELSQCWLVYFKLV